MADQTVQHPALTSIFAASVQHTATEPFISDVDIIDEKITIVNPSTADLNLTGYRISDSDVKHVYCFPDGFLLPAVSKVVLFCCPGKRAHVDDYQVNHLLWSNRDGTMRRKEVLNNGKRIILSSTYCFCLLPSVSLSL
jgi:hypothetical protein